MGSWGVKSYENDDAGEALDAAFEQVHSGRYNDLMDDGEPMTFEQVQETLADPQTLAAAVKWLVDEFGPNFDEWDEEARLSFAGVIVRHTEFHIPISEEWRARAISWLEAETIEWDDDTIRQLRRRKEIGMLKGTS